jgi:hypothetical protein
VPVGVATAAGVASPLVAAGSGELAVLAGLALVPLGLAWAFARLRRARRELQDAVPLDLAAAAVVDAYAELGELSAEAAASLAIEPRASGYLRVWLRDADADESARFAAALNDVVDPSGFPRYLVSRFVPGERSTLAALGRTLAFRPPFERRWLAVPADLGRRKERAGAFARACRRWLGPGELRFTQRTEEGKEALAAAGAQAADFEARRRRVWL